MNNPYYTYPNHPIHGGYTNFCEYNKNIEKVCNLINNILSINHKTKHMVYMAVGASMEEIPNSTDYRKYKQWRQLFPSYVEDVIIKTINCNIKNTIIIISPNNNFSENDYIDPIFIKKTFNTFRWDNIDQNIYNSQRYNTTVYVFCTKMPSENINRSQRTYNKIIQYQNTDMNLSSDNILQNDNDIDFIKRFYDLLDRLINNINGIFLCTSYATFAEGSMYSNNYKNYKMFRELKHIFAKSNKDNLVLSEWIHKTDNTKVKNIKGQINDYTTNLFEELNISTSHFF